MLPVRAFVVTDKKGHYASQRQYPAMALIQPRIDLASEEEGMSMFLTAPGMEEIEVKVPPHDCKATDVIEYVAKYFISTNRVLVGPISYTN